MKRIVLVVLIGLIMVFAVSADTGDDWLASDDPDIHFDASGWQPYVEAPDWPLTVAGSAFICSGVYLMAKHWWLPRMAEKRIGYETDNLLSDSASKVTLSMALEYDQTKAVAGAVMTFAGTAALIVKFLVLPKVSF